MDQKKIKIGLIGLGVVIVVGTLAYLFLGGPEEKEPVTVPQREMIMSAEVDDCTLRVKTNFKSFTVETNIGELYPRIDCFDPFHKAVSSSGRYLAYQDISGGVDSVVEVYSVDKGKSVRLDVLGTSQIFDMEFGSGERLFVLNGYEGIYDEQYLIAYDVGGLFSEYPENVRIDGNYFTNVKRYLEQFSLPEKGENYREVKLENGLVKLFGESGDLLEEIEL